jgi:hypothetical protein
VVSVGALGSAVVLFPSCSPPSRWWRAQVAVPWGTGVLLYLQGLREASGLTGPPEELASTSVLVNVVFQASLVAGLFSLVVRWRRSGPAERLQLKWVAYGVTLAGTTGLVVELWASLLSLVPGTSRARPVLSVAVLAVPVAIGVAMLRYRLYDIDLVINRTLVYTTMTVSLAAV